MCHFGGGDREYLYENPCKGFLYVSANAFCRQSGIKRGSFFVCHFGAGYATPIPAQPAKGGLLSFCKSTHLPPELEKAAFLIFPALKIKHPAFITGPGVLLDKKRLTVQKITQ